jgi:class 3 adenylate cyclase
MAIATSCGACGTELRPNARFCDTCGTAVRHESEHAEYKQVTVLFADVVQSMRIAATLGPERLREVLTELVDRSMVVINRYGGTLDKFTGDGIMAVFGAPISLEDHALRACLAALEIRDETRRLDAEMQRVDGLSLQLRIGLNSGVVIAGDVGSAHLAYTAIGEQVGMAQRMESAAQPGGVLLSESTARLVEHAATLGPSELVYIKNADQPVPVRRLLGVSDRHVVAGRVDSRMVGRAWEIAASEGVLDRSLAGHGGVVGVVGPAGIGKSRLAREVVAMAGARGVDVHCAFCESHAGDVPFHVITQLMREAFGVSELDDDDARLRLRVQVPDADERDLELLDDVLGIRDASIKLPKIDPDARRRRLTALVNSVSLARTRPVVYVIEDVHWIDEASESLILAFVRVIPQTASMLLITYRPEYRGALANLTGAHTITLAPLLDSEMTILVADLLGPDPALRSTAATIVARAAGNPYFAKEIVRDLAERGVLRGKRGAYTRGVDIAEVTVPPTLQATIAARIDRLRPEAKRTLSAAGVVGLRFTTDLLGTLGIDVVTDDLVAAELIDQVRFTPKAEFAFRHPLIRTVAYESLLRADRAELHRRLAAAVESGDPESADANSALIAEHLEAAGDLPNAYLWHLRSGAWTMNRDIAAARRSWERAKQVADALPTEDPLRLAMRLAPRTLLCGSAWRVHASMSGPSFEETRLLCELSDNKASLAIATAGLVMEYTNAGRLRESSQLATEYMGLVESVGDPTLTIALSYAAIQTKVETDELSDVLRWSDVVIDLADGNPTKGDLILGSPLAVAYASRALGRWATGHPGWQQDFEVAADIARQTDPMSLAIVTGYKYIPAIPTGALLSDDTALREINEAVQIVEQTGDDFGLAMSRFALGLALVHRPEPDRTRGREELARLREMCERGQYAMTELPMIDVFTARELARDGDYDTAISTVRAAVDQLFSAGQVGWCNSATRVMVDVLLARGQESDIREAEVATERLAAVIRPDTGLAMREVILLRMRALIARARGDEASFHDGWSRYRAAAQSHGYLGHIAMADAHI